MLKDYPVLKYVLWVLAIILLLKNVGVVGCIIIAIGYYLYHALFIYHKTLTKWLFIGIGLSCLVGFSQFLSTTVFVSCVLYGGYLRIKEELFK